MLTALGSFVGAPSIRAHPQYRSVKLPGSRRFVRSESLLGPARQRAPNISLAGSIDEVIQQVGASDFS